MSMSGIPDARIFELIDAYGADPNAFPEAERDAARRRLAEAPALFAEALEAARLLDGVFDAMPSPDVSPALRAALIAGAPAAPKRKTGRAGAGLMRFLPGWLPAGAVASLVMGLLIGVNVSLPATMVTASADDTTDAVMYAALGFDDEYTLIDGSAE